jgi:hypothetical protein
MASGLAKISPAIHNKPYSFLVLGFTLLSGLKTKNSIPISGFKPTQKKIYVISSSFASILKTYYYENIQTFIHHFIAFYC